MRLDSFWSRAANRQVARAAGVVASVAILVKLVATVKEFAVAGLYGRSDAMDAFLAASLVPALLVNLISESMNQALIPTLVRVRAQQGLARAQQLLSSSMLWTCLLLAAASLAMAAAAPWFFPLIASNFAADKLHLSVRLFYGLLPTVLFAGVAANCVAVLNTAGKFAAPALAPAAIPLAILAVTPLLRAQLGIWALAVSTVVGTLLYAALSARLMHSSGYKFHLAWSGPNEATREVARQYGPVLLSSVVASGGLLVDQAMAAMAAEPAAASGASVCVYDESWHQGVVGLVASRLKEKFWRPTLALAPAGGDEIRGSGRSIPDVHLRDVLDLVSKRHPGIIVKFGGHAMAAGLTLLESGYPDFTRGFDLAVRELSGRDSFDPLIETDGSLESGYANADVAGLLQQQVWGSGFPAPVFRDTFQVQQQRLLKDKHLKLSLARGNQRFDAIWFGHAEMLPEHIEAAYRLDKNVWNGMVSAQLIIEYASAA